MIISDYIVRSCGIGIRFSVLSIEMVCVGRSESRKCVLRSGIGGLCAYVFQLIQVVNIRAESQCPIEKINSCVILISAICFLSCVIVDKMNA